MVQRLDDGWVEVPSGHIVVLITLPSADYRTTEIHVRGEQTIHKAKNLLFGSNILLFEKAQFRTYPHELQFVVIPSRTLPFDGGGEDVR